MVVDKVYHSRYITIQIREVSEHRYYMSEKAHRDITDNDAFMDWCVQRHEYLAGKSHAERYSEDFERNKLRIFMACNALCGAGNCGGKDNCPLGLKAIHRLLGD